VQACDPQNFEPNLALNLEIADLINSKKGSAYALLLAGHDEDGALTMPQTPRSRRQHRALHQPPQSKCCPPRAPCTAHAPPHAPHAPYALPLLTTLQLLDICVKNCGYPFHLQISTKEFLNELVRRFPERPPVHESRVQNKILELIEEWRQTICQTSRYKDDLGFIRDMHRLLSYKGYRFPEVRKEDAAVLNPSDVPFPAHRSRTA